MRPLDHLVLPVADLNVARKRLSALGFTVAADGRHPFGTSNCCVYFADGAFIEPLAIADRGAYARAKGIENRFIVGDDEFRAAHGDEGLSAIVFGTDDAAQVHAVFARAGVSVGEMLDFSRPIQFPDGRTDVARFRLAFAETGHSGDVFAFCCERIHVPVADRRALLAHDNGVVGVLGVVLTAAEPQTVSRYLAVVSDSEPVLTQAGASLAFGAGRINVLTPRLFADTYGLEIKEETGLAGRLVVFAVASMADLGMKIAQAGIDHFINEAMLVVPPAAGQGVAFAFSEV